VGAAQAYLHLPAIQHSSYSIQQSPGEADRFSATQEIPRILWNPKDGSSESRMWGHGLDRSGSKYRQVAGACICGNEPSGSVTCGEYVDWPRTGQLVKKDSTPWSEQVLRLGFPSSLFPSALRTKTFYAPLLSPYVLR